VGEVEEEDDVPPEWHRRAAIALLRGEPLAEVIADMVAADIDEELAASLCAAILTDPTFDAGRWAMGQLAKLECVLDVRQQMADLGPRRFEVDRRKGLSRRKFLEEYYATNTPVVLEDLCEDWPARRLWSPEYLADKLGDTEVEVMTGRKSGSGNEINLDQHRTLMSFDDYVSQVLATEWSNELYLVANNKLLSAKFAAPLWKEFRFDRRYLKADRKKSSTFLWFGPGGTITSLHHDVLNILFHQVRGWKHFTLVSPTETHLLSNNIGVYSDVDPFAPDLERFPKFAKAHPLQVTVGPGDALFVPVGWWHHVTALEMSISVSCTSFVFPNTLHWVHPMVEP
jgi:ribosomal protein L16 Arg81 hydroxylase